MSSPPPAPSSFEGLFASRTPQQDVFASPAQRSLFQYPESPFQMQMQHMATMAQTPDNRVKSKLTTLGGQFLVSPLGGGATPQASQYMVDKDTPVMIADPNQAPSWDNVNEGFNPHPHPELAHYSPFKQQTMAPMLIPGSLPPTPKSRKPRSVSGLGTPTGVQRSAKRIRQATYDSNPMSPTRLTTSAPLSRSVSYMQPFQDRNVSTTSTAASWEHVMSPTISYVQQDYPAEMPPLESSQQSPNLSTGRSPPATPQLGGGRVYYTSPASEQGGFDIGSTSMQSVASFGNFRQSTLGTIMETPDVASGFPTGQLPSQPVFQHVEYPAVPNMTLNYPSYQSEWNNNQTFYIPQYPGLPQRHASTSYLNYQMRPEITTFPVVPRSVSASYIQQSQPVMPLMPPSMPNISTFQSAPPQPQPLPRPEYHHQYEEDTPRKRQTFPPVGKRLRPGPKPKPKTPKKGKSVQSSPVEEEDKGGSSPQLVFGPDLAMVRSSSSVEPSSSTSVFSSQPFTSTETFQPTLSLQPPRNTYNDQPVSGLPRAFLETLYTCFLTMEGSLTGQPVKRFRCLIDGCERHFPRKSAIHSHIQTHLEDKPYVCTAEDCHAAFVRQHDLRRHTRIHSGTKPFPCPCGKGFARGDALMRHRQRGICSGSLVPRRESP